MRFNSTEHIDAWKANGSFPAIHQNVVAMARTELINVNGIDLCCSHGLLGAQLEHYGFNMLGIDDDNAAVTASRTASIPMSICKLKVTRTTFEEVKSVIALHKTEFIIARRCLPELFGNDLDFGRHFFQAIENLGVHEIIIEGRVKTPKATNFLSSVEREIELLTPTYRVHKQVGNVAYLRSNEVL